MGKLIAGFALGLFAFWFHSVTDVTVRVRPNAVTHAVMEARSAFNVPAYHPRYVGDAPQLKTRVEVQEPDDTRLKEQLGMVVEMKPE